MIQNITIVTRGSVELQSLEMPDLTLCLDMEALAIAFTLLLKEVGDMQVIRAHSS